MQHLNAQVNLSYAILIFVKIPDFFGLWLKLEEVPTIVIPDFTLI